VEEKDYVKYDRTKNIPPELSTVESRYGSAETYPTIYYQIRKDHNHTDISLNSGTYTITPAGEGTPAVTKTYDGHYLNEDTGTTDYNKLSTNAYHEKTYAYDKVHERSEPLYWQATNIPVEIVNNEKKPFYHEYILKVSWDTSVNLTELSKYKDTDIVYITVSVK